MDISLTSAKQEKDIVQKIIEQATYSENLEKVKLELSQFEGKHFRHLKLEQLFQRVKDISTKLRNLKLINDYSVRDNKNATLGLSVTFDVKDKIPNLQQYKQKVENDIAKIEIQSKLKKGKFFTLDFDTKSVHFEFPNGAVQTIHLRSQLSKSDHMYFLVKVLYEYWLKFEDKFIPKSKIISELDKLGWQDVSDEQIKIYIGNLRSKKIQPADLSNYIKVLSDRKLKGYKLKIIYPDTPIISSYSESK